MSKKEIPPAAVAPSQSVFEVASTTTKTTKTRVLDPEIAKLRTEHAARVEEVRRRKQSASTLARIVNKDLARLIQEDKTKLFDHLGKQLAGV